MTRQLSQLDGRSYARLAEVAFVPQSILFPSSWCPTMDLFVVASPLSNRHRLTLWKMSGAKLWDVEVGRGVATHERIVSIAWSPHGTSHTLCISSAKRHALRVHSYSLSAGLHRVLSTP